MLQTLFPKLLNMSLTASVVILAVLLARLALRRAPKIFSYVLWAVVLFRLLCPVSFEAPFGMVQREIVSEDPSMVGESVSAADMVGTADQTVEDGGDGTDIPFDVVRTDGEDANGFLGAGSAYRSEILLRVGSYVWLCGVAVMVIRAARQTVRLRRRLVGAVPLGGRVWLADHIETPFVMGVIRPRIYLPSSLGEAERAYILLHEQHHIRRGDHAVRMLGFVALCLHWFNPLVWVAFVLSGRDMEMSCDEAVMRKMEGDIRADYSASLLRLATGRSAIVGTPLAFGEGDTRSRVKNVLKYKKPMTWVVVIAVIVCLALVLCLAANRTTEKQDRLAAAVYRMGDIRYPDMVVLYDDFASGVHNRYAAEIEQVYITSDMHLYLGFDADVWDYQGRLEPYELSERMRDLVPYHVTDAYILRFDVSQNSSLKDGDFLLFMQTRSGKTLYAFGWEDIAERDDVYSDDSLLYVLYLLENTFEEPPADNKSEAEMVATLPERVSVAHIVNNNNVGVVTLTEESVRRLLELMENAPLVDISHPVYQNGTPHDNCYMVRVENVVRDEYVLHDDMFDCFIWAYNGEFFLDGYREPENGAHIQRIGYDLYRQIFQAFYPVPEQITVLRYVEKKLVGSVVLTDEESIMYWYEKMKSSMESLEVAVRAHSLRYDDGFVIRLEYGAEDGARDGVEYIDCSVWKYEDRYYVDTYGYPYDYTWVSSGAQAYYEKLSALFAVGT